MVSKQSSKAAKGPVITSIAPAAAIPGGDLHIRGKGLAANGRPAVYVGAVRAHLAVASDSYIVARVPEGASEGEITVATGDAQSEVANSYIGIQVADSLHPVANPAVDGEGKL